VSTSKLAPPGRAHWRVPRTAHPSPAALRCRIKFLRRFPKGFQDDLYLDRERSNTWTAHEAWTATLGPEELHSLLAEKNYGEIAVRALKVESQSNLLSSVEKAALRHAITTPSALEVFGIGLSDFLTASPEQESFDRWAKAVATLPRKQTRALTWPLVTAFGFIARPDTHIFLKPNITKIGARHYGFDFRYAPVPNWDTYSSLLDFAGIIQQDQKDLEPRDMIDVQAFIRVQGSGEY
jgi:hypothetical protein